VGRRRIALGLALAGALVALSITVLPGLAARRIATEISESLATPVRVGRLGWNPFTGEWNLSDLRIAADRGPAALLARRVTAEIHLGDLLHGVYRVRDLALDGARVRLRATPGGWQLPLPSGPAQEAGAPTPAVRLDWGVAPRAQVRLEPRTGVRSSLRLRQLELTGTLGREGLSGAFWTRGRLDRGSLAVVGRLRTRSDAHRLRLRVSAVNLDLARVLRLTEDAPVADLRGSVDLRAKYDEAGDRAHARRRITGSASGQDVALRASGVPALWLRNAALSRFDVDLDRHSLALGALHLRRPEVWLRRTGSELGIPALSTSTPSAPGAKWTVTLAGADVIDGALHYLDTEDAERSFDVTLEHARAGPLATMRAALPFTLVAGLGTGGRLTATGQLVCEPVSVKLHGELADLALPPLTTLTQSLLRLESGRGAGSFDLAFAAGVLDGSGRLVVSDVKTVSPDRQRPEDVMAFKEARLTLRRARSDPPAATFDKVEIDWPYVLIDRSPAGIFPFSLFSRPAADPDRPPPSVRVDALRVLGARIDFRDAVLTPPYWRAVANLGIEASALEAPSIRIAELHASGLVDELSPLKVEGTIGSRTHLVGEVERLALPPFNAYLGGTSSYTVSSGVVSGRSEITLERSELEVNNQVVLSRLGLSGNPGDDFAKRQLGIPLTLALALMKDYRGDIALDLPFGGNLTEPTFSMRSVVLQGIVQAVRGAILSPLNALGRVLVRDGRIERIDLDPIPFRPGERALDAAGRERIAQVARVLVSHPGLKVHPRGLVAQADLDRMRDEAALSALVDAAAAEPLRAFLRARLAGAPPPALNDGQRNRLEALVAGLSWPTSALHDLAVDRGAVAAATLILEHTIDPARVVADPPEVPGPEQLATAPGVAVEVRER